MKDNIIRFIACKQVKTKWILKKLIVTYFFSILTIPSIFYSLSKGHLNKSHCIKYLNYGIDPTNWSLIVCCFLRVKV